MNLEEETRCGYLITAKMKSVWNIQIDLVQKLLEVCKRYDLRIWADSGTLIGTIRHKGYIPWDDDIDLVMMRDDYDKLLAVSNAEFKSPYFFQTAYSEHAPYSHGHAQLRMNGTTAILHGNEHMNIHLGIFIDIFVLDNVPENLNELNNMGQSIEKLHKQLSLRMLNRVIITKKINVMIRSMLNRFMPIQTFLNKYRRMDDFAKNYADKNSVFVAPILLCQDFDFLKRVRLRKEWFKETLWMPFEDIMLPVPNGYHEILTQQYGDYMKPVKAPTMHGGFLVLDPDKDYKEYLPELRRQAKKNFWKKVLVKLHLKK